MANLTENVPADTMTDAEKKRKGWRVLMFGVLSNFSIGILYTWSNIKDIFEYRLKNFSDFYEQGVPEALATGIGDAARMYPAWQQEHLSLPYAIGGFLSALIVVVAGRMQDVMGPTKVIFMGILMVGGGSILSSFFTQSPWGFTIVFSLLIGNGIGFVYACPRAAAMKWFHPSKKGLVNGLVVAGFGLGALWLGPLEILFLKSFGWSLELTLQVLGGLILVLGIIAALNVYDPPAGYKYPELPAGAVKIKTNQRKSPSIGTMAMAKQAQTWMLFWIYALFCSAGALVISNASDIMRVQSGGEDGPHGALVVQLVSIMVLVASASNATGRTLGGIVSDKIGRKPVYYIIHTIQAINMFMFHYYTTPTLIIIGVIITCMAYGTTMSTTPSVVADYWGLKAYGANYGVVYTGWGASLIIGPLIASYSKKYVAEHGLDPTTSYHIAYYAAIGLIAVSALLVFLLKRPKFKQEEVIDDAVLLPEETRA